MMIAVQILTFVVQLVSWGLAVAFGVWLHRRVPLRSLPWIGAYMVLTIPPLSLLNALLIKHVFGKQTLPLGWSNSITPGAFLVQMTTWNRLFVTIAMLLLTVLFLSDLVFVLSRAGIEPDKKAWRRLLVIRQWSTPVGMAAVMMLLIGQVAAFLLYVFL